MVSNVFKILKRKFPLDILWPYLFLYKISFSTFYKIIEGSESTPSLEKNTDIERSAQGEYISARRNSIKQAVLLFQTGFDEDRRFF